MKDKESSYFWVAMTILVWSVCLVFIFLLNSCFMSDAEARSASRGSSMRSASLSRPTTHRQPTQSKTVNKGHTEKTEAKTEPKQTQDTATKEIHHHHVQQSSGSGLTTALMAGAVGYAIGANANDDKKEGEKNEHISGD